MQINFLEKSKYIISSLILAVVLFLSILSGVSSGKQQAESEVVLTTGQAVISGLKYFYKDQNHFPSATEFADKETMDNYFINFPPKDFVSATCPQSFAYKRVTSQNFELSFCLQKSVNGYKAGWNTYSGKN